jgi:hypothetical protein
VSASDDYDNGEIDGMISKGSRSTRRKPAEDVTLADLFGDIVSIKEQLYIFKFICSENM